MAQPKLVAYSENASLHSTKDPHSTQLKYKGMPFVLFSIYLLSKIYMTVLVPFWFHVQNKDPLNWNEMKLALHWIFLCNTMYRLEK